MSERQYDTVCQTLYSTCEKFGDQTAQVFNPDLYYGDNNGSFTYSEMLERIEAIACGLMKMGLKKKDMVGIMCPSNPYWTQTDLGISCAGGISVTIYPTLSLNEVNYIMNDSGSKYLFVGNEDILNTVLEGFGKMKKLKKIVVMDLKYESKDDKTIGLSALMEMGREFKKDNSAKYEERWKSIDIDDGFTILYTSGTTGMGKGVNLTNWCMSSRMVGVIEYFATCGMILTEKDRTLCFLPLSHIFERGSCQLLALTVGASIAYADKPGTLLEDMQKYNPTWINCVPRLYEKIYITFQQQMAIDPKKKKLFDWALKVGEKAIKYRMDDNGCYNMSPDFDLVSKLPFFLKMKFKIADKLFAKVRALFGNRFRYSFSASAGIAPDLLKFYYILGLAVVEGYGSTESCNACVLNPLTACKPGYIGVEANGAKVRIADDGELEISGPGIFKGYLNKPDENKESFTKDGWFKTGDLVIMGEDKYIKIVDRKKAIICTAVGKNIAPAKIENLFSTSSVVEQIFLIGDERNFISGLVVPSFNYFSEYFDKEGISYDKDKMVWSDASGANICMSVGDDFVAQEALKELVDKDIQAANEQLENFERVKQYTILPTRFSEENGQLTPTQKTKKKAILEAYAGKIDKMYE
ncbi:MAG: long-chain fatty acid--CoA ligase [bacterium]|nr:long-chain fatty acid--CoA ligase [bacterium]